MSTDELAVHRVHVCLDDAYEPHISGLDPDSSGGCVAEASHRVDAP
jgi:hypothetical protein